MGWFGSVVLRSLDVLTLVRSITTVVINDTIWMMYEEVTIVGEGEVLVDTFTIELMTITRVILEDEAQCVTTSHVVTELTSDQTRR